MSSTLTVPTDEVLKTALRKRAEAQGKPVPEMAREILSQVLLGTPLGERIGHLKGKLELTPEYSDPWRDELRARNWRS